MRAVATLAALELSRLRCVRRYGGCSPTPLMHRDRRRTQRATTDLEAVWKRGPRRVPVRIRELNVHGASLVASEAPEVNYLIDVEIALDGVNVSLVLVTRSVRIEGTRFVVGVEIHSAPSDAQNMWVQGYRRITGAGAGAGGAGGAGGTTPVTPRRHNAA